MGEPSVVGNERVSGKVEAGVAPLLNIQEAGSALLLFQLGEDAVHAAAVHRQAHQAVYQAQAADGLAPGCRVLGELLKHCNKNRGSGKSSVADPNIFLPAPAPRSRKSELRLRLQINFIRYLDNYLI